MLEFYSMIGLIYRGDYNIPPAYNEVLSDIAKADPYQVGGTLIGMCYQFIGANSEDTNVLVRFMEVFDKLDMLKPESRPPIIHGLAIATGLLCLSRNDEDIND